MPCGHRDLRLVEVVPGEAWAALVLALASVAAVALALALALGPAPWMEVVRERYRGSARAAAWLGA